MSKPNDVRRTLIDLREHFAAYGSDELLALKHTAEATTYLIKRELDHRDAALIDTLSQQEH